MQCEQCCFRNNSAGKAASSARIALKTLWSVLSLAESNVSVLAPGAPRCWRPGEQASAFAPSVTSPLSRTSGMWSFKLGATKISSYVTYL